MAIDISKKEQLWKDYQTNLAQAQRESELARRQADEAAFLRQRQMNQALMGRGLAGSGLQQLTQAQGQLQLSQQLNQQAAQGAGTRAGLYQQYQQNLGAAEQQGQQVYSTIMNTALASGKTGQDLTDFANVLAKGYGATLTAEQLGAIEATGEATQPLSSEIIKANAWEPFFEKVRNRNTGEGSFKLFGINYDVTNYAEAAKVYKNALMNKYKNDPNLSKIEVSAVGQGPDARILIGATSGYNFSFKTTDGRVFDKLQDAINHQAVI